MRTTRRAAVTAVVIAASSLVAACTPPPTTSPAGTARKGAADWLTRQFDTTTHLIPSAFTPGAVDVGGSAYAVTSLAIAGRSDATQLAAVDALESHVEEFVDDGTGHDLPGSLARLILAAVAVGHDPHDFGGIDLVARLEATLQPSGQFGVQDSTYDGAFRQGISLAALSLVSPTPATIDPGAGAVEDLPAVAWLLDQQCADGSWQPIRTDLSTPCAFDPVTFSGPESNSTSMATLGLRAVDATPHVDPNNWFAAIRSADGGWSYDGTGSSDPDSTGLVIAARRALGIAPDAAAISALTSFQFGPSATAEDRGAFYYPPFSGPPVANLLATNDAMVGLAPSPWPGVLAG
jgi:hypothetical protein